MHLFFKMPVYKPAYNFRATALLFIRISRGVLYCSLARTTALIALRFGFCASRDKRKRQLCTLTITFRFDCPVPVIIVRWAVMGMGAAAQSLHAVMITLKHIHYLMAARCDDNFKTYTHYQIHADQLDQPLSDIYKGGPSASSHASFIDVYYSYQYWIMMPCCESPAEFLRLLYIRLTGSESSINLGYEVFMKVKISSKTSTNVTKKQQKAWSFQGSLLPCYSTQVRWQSIGLPWTTSATMLQGSWIMQLRSMLMLLMAAVWCIWQNETQGCCMLLW